MLQIGDHVPGLKWRERRGPDWWDLSTRDVFEGKRVVLFSLPGAFTPTCSSKQLPGYEKAYAKITKLDVDEVYCLSVNDTFVMNAWADSLKIKKVKMIPDGYGAFTEAMGLLVAKPKQGFGMRSWRYSMVVDNSRIEAIFVEEGFNHESADDDPYVQTTPETMLEYLKNPTRLDG